MARDKGADSLHEYAQPQTDLISRASAESISIVIPAYDDAENIGVVIEASLATLAQLTDDYEIVIVNDVSTDDTGEVIERYAAENPARAGLPQRAEYRLPRDGIERVLPCAG